MALLEGRPIIKCGSPLSTLMYYHDITHLLSNTLTFGESDVFIMRHEVGIEWPGGEKEMRVINLVRCPSASDIR